MLAVENGVHIVGFDFPTLTIVMLLYSFIGWFYESTIFSLCEQGKIMNRGCFIGPYCPIYSVVCILSIYLLDGVDNSLKIVFIGGLSVCVVEYFTSVALEKVFHARYWDYSYFPLNINGRVSAVSGLFFGLAVLLLKKVVYPLCLDKMSLIPFEIKFYASIAIWIVFIVDVIFTTIAMCELNRKCKEIYDAWDNYVEDKLDTINSKKDYLSKFIIVEKGKQMVVKFKNANAKLTELETRYIKINPSFKSTKYQAVISRLSESIRKNKTLLAEYDDIEQVYEEEERQTVSRLDKLKSIFKKKKVTE